MENYREISYTQACRAATETSGRQTSASELGGLVVSIKVLSFPRDVASQSRFFHCQRIKYPTGYSRGTADPAFHQGSKEKESMQGVNSSFDSF